MFNYYRHWRKILFGAFFASAHTLYCVAWVAIDFVIIFILFWNLVNHNEQYTDWTKKYQQANFYLLHIFFSLRKYLMTYIHRFYYTKFVIWSVYFSFFSLHFHICNAHLWMNVKKGGNYSAVNTIALACVGPIELTAQWLFDLSQLFSVLNESEIFFYENKSFSQMTENKWQKNRLL